MFSQFDDAYIRRRDRERRFESIVRVIVIYTGGAALGWPAGYLAATLLYFVTFSAGGLYTGPITDWCVWGRHVGFIASTIAVLVVVFRS